MCQSRLETRGLPRDTCATSYSQIQSRRKWKQLARTCVRSRTKKKPRTNTHTHTHAGIFVCLKDRDGEIQSPPTDGYHASGKEQVWTANWQLLPKQRGMRGKKTKSTSSMYILTECEARLMKAEEHFIHVTLCIWWQFFVGCKLSQPISSHWNNQYPLIIKSS